MKKCAVEFIFVQWLTLLICSGEAFHLLTSPKKLESEVGRGVNFTLYLDGVNLGAANETPIIEVINKFPDSLEVYPRIIEIDSRNFSSWQHTFYVRPRKPGKFHLNFTAPPGTINGRATEGLGVDVNVIRSDVLADLSSWCGIISYTSLFLSVYPQLIANYVERSVDGLDSNYVALNVLSFGSLSIVSGYRHRQSIEWNYKLIGNLSAINGLIISLLILYQIVNYPPNKGRIMPKYVGAAVVFFLCALFIYDIINNTEGTLLTILAIYFSTNSAKYIPQMVENFKLKSTTVWTIWTPIIEAFAIAFSLMEIIIDKLNSSETECIFMETSIWFSLWCLVNNFVLIGHRLVFTYKNHEEIDDDDQNKGRNLLAFEEMSW